MVVEADIFLPYNANQPDLEPRSQVIFNSSSPLNASDVRGTPNIASRMEVTSNGTLYCGRPEDSFESGYVHLTNSAGEEDKHLFWCEDRLFKARHDPKNAPVVMTLGGGPGASGMLFPFSGAGPCSITVNATGGGEAIPSLYSWTEHANLLAIDHPVGVGFSYGDQASLRNSSLTAAWDTDDFLQAFWKYD
ncbi:Alpha/Beta hydrolase protein [Rhodocollybia butyracea]|uniref:Alpha/Beta hydrolase protein n=1 Tax=Rhodocollybia butyracea TaxID=206335 RepID=A0A9P5PSE3_9AGAR|nr:Alpha/Beta hydrolase protein [Rhodocollybia butyracea]